MAYLLRGALVEYGNDLTGPLKNVVMFQFNPESLTRTIQMPQRPTDPTKKENNQSGDLPIEKITFVAHFDASDQLGSNDSLSRAHGVGPQLAALEQMAYPDSSIGDLATAAVDAIGSAISGKKPDVTQPVPRVEYPKILFIWGVARVLPVIIESMSISEKLYDSQLNPVSAEVTMGLAVKGGTSTDDDIANGASAYTNLMKKSQATANMANAGRQIDIIPF